jgi:diguanylate cyclase (GGDEF)-like protein
VNKSLVRKANGKKHLFYLLVIFASFLFKQTSVWAQELPYANLSISDGLEDMVIFDIEQDDQGFLWMTTRTGINRFDGSRFWTYNRSHGLPHNLVRDLHKAKDGTLWAASEAGLAWFDGKAFQSMSTDIWPTNVSGRVLKEASDGTIWVATYGMGLVHIQPGKEPKIIKVYDKAAGFPNDRIRSLMIDNNGNIWAGDSRQVIKINQDKQITTYNLHDASSEIRTIFQNIDGEIWVGTRQGAAVYDGNSFVPLEFDIDLSQQTINSITLDNQQHIWISSRDFGAYEFNQDRVLVKHLNMSNGLPDNSINTIFEDNENNMWFGSYGGGVARLSAANVTNWKAQPDMPNPNVYAIIQDNMGCIWIGTNGDGVSKLCNGKMTHITTNEGLSHNKVLTAVIDNDGNPWFGTLHGITYIKDNQFIKLHIADGLAGPVIYHIIKAIDHSLWIATNNGLNHFKDNELITYSTDDGLPDNRINRIFQSRNGDIWLASSNGLSLLKDGKFTNWSTENGLAANFINDIFEDESGLLWLATNDGLSLFNGEIFTTWTTEQGLPHNNATAILPGKNGDIWIGTSRGVAIYNGENFTVITSREGLVFDLVNRGAGFKDPEGNLWFGTGNGISKFDADFKPGSSLPPPVHLLSVTNDSEHFVLNINNTIEQQNSNLTFKFTAISFQRAPDISYRYRLATNDDTSWRETRLNEIQINSLAAGNYEFQVTARIGNGQWNAHPAIFKFSVTPPFWRTPWFVLLIIAALIAYMLYRNWRNQQHAMALENTVQERTQQLEKLNEGLDWMANHDNLTRLSNRYHVQEVLKELSQSKTALPLGVINIDLDYFKKVNDQYGHHFGDQVLKTFSQMLAKTANSTFTVSRWGGEEFIILCPTTTVTELQSLSDQIIKKCRTLRIKTENDTEIMLSCSIGFVHLPCFNPNQNKVTQMEKIIQLADKALYTAKDNGRDQWYGFVIDQPPEDIKFSTYLNDTDKAVNQGWLKTIN